MADDQTIIIKLNLDPKDYDKSLADTAKGTEKTGDKIGRTFEARVSQRMNKSFSALKVAAIGLGATIAGAFAARKVIDASNTQIDAINRLNQAMASAGRFSREASESFQNFASEMQKISVVGDEVALNSLAIAQTFARTNEQAQDLTRAALDLSAATGVSLESAIRQLGVTLSGQAGALSRTVMGVRELTAEQLKAGAAIELVTQRFAGSAQAQTRTFSGAITQLSNTWGDLLEKVGDLVTKSPVLVEVFKIIGESVERAGTSVEKLGNTGPIDNMILALVRFSQAIVANFVAPLELAWNLAQFVFNSVTLVAQTIVAALSNILKFGASVAEFFGSESKLTRGIIESVNVINDVTKNMALDTLDSFSGILDFDHSAGTANFLEAMQLRLEAAQALGLTVDAINQAVSGGDEEDPLADKRSAIQLLKDSFIDMSEGMKAEANGLAANMQKNFKQIGSTMMKGIATGAGNAFAAFGRAVATGENAMQAFLNSFLSSMGQMAVQLGTQFILQGAGFFWLGDPRGVPLMKAGAALAAFGGFLSGMGGGASASTGGMGPGGAQQAPPLATPEIITPDEIEDQGPQTQVTVQIQGDVMDSDETGLRIVDLLGEYLDRNGNGVMVT